MGGGPPLGQDDADVNAAVKRSCIGPSHAAPAGSILAACWECSMLQASLEIQRPVRVDKRPPVAISTRLLSSTEERHSWIRTAMSEVARHSRTLLVTSH